MVSVNRTKSDSGSQSILQPLSHNDFQSRSHIHLARVTHLLSQSQSTTAPRADYFSKPQPTLKTFHRCHLARSATLTVIFSAVTIVNLPISN